MNVEPLRVRILDAMEDTGPITADAMALHVGEPLQRTRQYIHYLMKDSLVEEVGRRRRIGQHGQSKKLYDIRGAAGGNE